MSLADALGRLLEDSSWTWNSTAPVAVIRSPPTALEFHRSYVARNVPVVIEGLQNGWRAVEDLRDLLPDEEWLRANGNLRDTHEEGVCVNVTPNGKGDAVVCDETLTRGAKWFVKPEERRVPLASYFEWLERKRRLSDSEWRDGIFYLSAQNDCLRRDFGYLIEKGFAPDSHPFGDEVFGKKADAANLWIGDERAVSCIHRDTTYENLYSVVRGTKIFDLMCPVVAPLLEERPFPTARYHYRSAASSFSSSTGATSPTKDVVDDRRWTIELEEGSQPTEWIEYDPVAPPKTAKEAKLKQFVIRVIVKAGQTLFLPSGWFHRVTQIGPTVAFNWWYDVDFDARFLLQRGYEELMRGGV